VFIYFYLIDVNFFYAYFLDSGFLFGTHKSFYNSDSWTIRYDKYFYLFYF